MFLVFLGCVAVALTVTFMRGMQTGVRDTTKIKWVKDKGHKMDIFYLAQTQG